MIIGRADGSCIPAPEPALVEQISSIGFVGKALATLPIESMLIKNDKKKNLLIIFFIFPP